MQIKDKSVSFRLFVAKLVKVSRIKVGFFIPTLKAKIILNFLKCPYGKNLKVCGKVYFRLNSIGTIKLGNNVKLIARFLSNGVGITNPILFECINNGIIEIGNNSGLTAAILSSRKFIKIGNNVKIGGNVKIFDHDFHSPNYLNRRNSQIDFNNVKVDGIVIEDDVFIGTNAILLKGVHVGARSIIAAGSVVTLKDIPQDSLVAGNPAVIIKKLI